MLLNGISIQKEEKLATEIFKAIKDIQKLVIGSPLFMSISSNLFFYQLLIHHANMDFPKDCPLELGSSLQ